MIFLNILRRKGVNDVRKLTGFVDRFLQDPSIFFDLTALKEVRWKKN